MLWSYVKKEPQSKLTILTLENRSVNIELVLVSSLAQIQFFNISGVTAVVSSRRPRVILRQYQSPAPVCVRVPAGCCVPVE